MPRFGGGKAGGRGWQEAVAQLLHALSTPSVYQIPAALRHPGAGMCCFVHILMCHLAVDACTAE